MGNQTDCFERGAMPPGGRWGFLMKRMGAASGALEIGKSKTRVYMEKAGVEMVDFEKAIDRIVAGLDRATLGRPLTGSPCLGPGGSGQITPTPWSRGDVLAAGLSRPAPRGEPSALDG